VWNNVLRASLLSRLLGAVGVDNGRGGGWEKIRGDHAMTLNGRTYHFLPETGGAGGLQYFTFEGSNNVNDHFANGGLSNKRKEALESAILLNIFTELKLVNPLVQDCLQIGRLAGQGTLERETIPTMIATMNASTCAFDVAAISSDTTTGDRILTYKLKSTDKARSIPLHHKLWEALSYPLLFPFGEDGWGKDIRSTVRFTNYLCSRMLCPDRNEDNSVLMCLTKDGEHTVPCNRFQLPCNRLGQLYLVDMTSRAIDFRLYWQKYNQEYIFGGPQPEAADTAEDNQTK
jgi:hypothetical protein